MLKGVTYRKSKPTRAAAVLITVVIIAASFLAPFVSISDGESIILRFDVEDYDLEYSFDYTYGGNTYQIEIDVHIPGRTYYYYADQARVADPTGKYTMDYAAYVVIDEAVQKIADALTEIAESISSTQYCLASLILTFVHQTKWLRDNDGNGVEIEDPKYPVETLIERGDCEDLAALYVSLCIAAGLDAVLFMFPSSPGHMAAGVSITDGSQPSNIKAYWTDDDGTAYYFCETTSSFYSFGNGNYWNRQSDLVTLTEFDTEMKHAVSGSSVSVAYTIS